MLLGNKNLDNINALPWKFQMPESREALAQTSAKRGGEVSIFNANVMGCCSRGPTNLQMGSLPPKGHMELMPNGEGDKKAITGEPQVGTSGPIELI